MSVRIKNSLQWSKTIYNDQKLSDDQKFSKLIKNSLQWSKVGFYDRKTLFYDQKLCNDHKFVFIGLKCVKARRTMEQAIP